MKLSICFTVYNQIDILEKQLHDLHDSNSSDIEVVISDDCSTDDIKKCVDSFDDNRFRYFRTPKNLGHDLNILHAIDHASYDFVAVFRTKDNIKINNIDKILTELDKNKSTGYFLFSADYEDRMRLSFVDRIYNIGEETCYAHFYLPEHPSGNIYRKEYLDTDLYKKYIENYFDDIYGFSVHSLIRCDLSRKACFMTSSLVGWTYYDTLGKKERAVNSTANGKNVYSPEYCIKRFICQFSFIKQEISENQVLYLKKSIKQHYSFILGRSITISNDERYCSHYDSQRVKYNRKIIAKELDKVLSDLICDYQVDTRKELTKYSKSIKRKYIYAYPIKEALRNLLLKTPVYTVYKTNKSKKKL